MNKYWEIQDDFQNNQNKQVANEFLLSLKLANRSQGTIELYNKFLVKFFRDQRELFSSLTSETIQQWFTEHESGVKEPTLRLRLSIMSSFFTFCVQEEYMEKSPMKSRWFPRLPKPIPKYLEKGDIAKTRVHSENISLRDQAMVELMLTSGIRIAELHGLNHSDLDLENRTARVVGKGKKIREVHFSDKCAVLLERYIKSQQELSEALFVSADGKRIGIRRIQKIVNKLGKDAGMASRLYPHRLRHTFATELLSKGAELSFIADELGHSSVDTTQIYARLPKREIISLYRKFMG